MTHDDQGPEQVVRQSESAPRSTASAGSPIEALARSASRIDLSVVSQEIREHAIAVVADTIGVMLGGGAAPEIAALARDADDPIASATNGRAQLVTVGQPRAGAVSAAFVNASAGTFLELDEFVLPGSHPAIHVVPAALAAAQTLGRSGVDLLAAVLSGYEVVARLFRAYRLDSRVQPHGHLPAVGAAVAVARLLDVDAGPPAAIAASFPLLTLWEPSFEGATVHYTYAGAGAAIGVFASRLARSGFTGSQAALPIAFGEIAGELYDADALADPIEPDDLMIGESYIKLYGCCGNSYAAIEAVLSLGPIDPNAVCAVEVETVSQCLTVARYPRPNSLSAQFSMEYAVAAAIVHGHAQPSAFAPDELSLALAHRVQVRGAPDLDDLGPDVWAARVVVQLDDGSRSAEVRDPSAGYLRRPLPSERLREKFETLAVDPATGQARVNYGRLLELESLTDVSDLLTP